MPIDAETVLEAGQSRCAAKYTKLDRLLIVFIPHSIATLWDALFRSKLSSTSNLDR